MDVGFFAYIIFEGGSIDLIEMLGVWISHKSTLRLQTKNYRLRVLNTLFQASANIITTLDSYSI